MPPHGGLEEGDHPRLEDGFERAVVGGGLRRLDLRGCRGADEAGEGAGERRAGVLDLGGGVEGEAEVERFQRGLAGGDRGQVAAQPVELARLGSDGAAVREVGDGEGEGAEDEHGGGADRGAAPDPGPAGLGLGVERAEARLAEDDVGEEPLEEEAARLHPG